MPITLTCTCGKSLQADEQHRGETATCPACGNVFVVGDKVTTTTAVQAGEPTIKPALKGHALPVGDRSIVKPIVGRFPTWSLMLAAVFIIVMIVWLAWAFLQARSISTQRDAASFSVKGPLTHACKTYFIRNERFPDNLEMLLLKDAFLNGPYLEDADLLRDPWGMPYQYDPAGPRNKGVRPDIWTTDPDGTIIGNWPPRLMP